MKRALGLALVAAMVLPAVAVAQSDEQRLCLTVTVADDRDMTNVGLVRVGLKGGAINVTGVIPCDGSSASPAEDNEASEADGASTSEDGLAFSPIKLSGKGDKVARFNIPEDSAATATFDHAGKSNFAVTSIAADGSANDLLINEIGKYKGTVLFDADSHSVAFKVEADGKWTATIKPVLAARK